jgi:hypothetical protein
MRAIAALCMVAPLACKSAVRPTVAEAADAGVPDAGPPDAGPPQPQPGAVIATVGDVAVLALDAPMFAALPREQRLVAFWVSQAVAEANPWHSGHTLEVLRLVRGILSRPAVVPPMMLPRVREFARAMYLNHGLHDTDSRRKLGPPFSFSELRMAVLAAQAAGASLGQPGLRVEYFLRALEGPLFDPRVDPLPVPPVPEVDRLQRAAGALDQAAAFANAPQRQLLEGFAAHLRGREPLPGWVDVAAPVDFFLDETHALIGIVDEERSAAMRGLTPSPPRLAEALYLAGGRAPLPSLAFTKDGKAALFLAAGDAVEPVRSAGVVKALADPALAPELLRCLPRHRFAWLALREVMGRRADKVDATLEEARADVTAHMLAQATDLLDPRCRELWPQFAATSWLASAAHLPQGDRVDDPHQRAIQLQIWWFTGNGGLVERHSGARRFLWADPARFQRSATELFALLQDIAGSRDLVRLRNLLESHASKIDTQWRDEVIERLRAAGVPRRVAILPPVLTPVVADGKVVDAQAKAVDDLDAQILKDWSSL